MHQGRYEELQSYGAINRSFVTTEVIGAVSIESQNGSGRGRRRHVLGSQEKHESSHISRRDRHQDYGGDVRQAKAYGRNRRPAHFVAHHEDLL